MFRPIPALTIPAFTATSALGRGLDAHARALRERVSGLRRNDFTRSQLDCWIGRVDGLEDAALPAEHAAYECRNNRLAWLGLQQDGFLAAAHALREHCGADRVALVLGTSTASIGETERAYRELDADGRFPANFQRPAVHHPHSLGEFVQVALGLRGPCVTVATACSSSAKVFAQAERLIRSGVADAAVVGGVDTLCDSVLFGFNALELVSPEPCRPFDVERRGISIGEAAGFALLTKDGVGPRLLGWGESSDAYHMSTPHPEGLGARLSVTAALQRAGLPASAIDYINLHGTASQKNDAVEAVMVADLFPAHTLASSTKGWTGHALGAAGILEAVISLLALRDGLAPGTLNASTLDPLCGPQIRAANSAAALRHALSNSFGFGGNNCTLVFAHQ